MPGFSSRISLFSQSLFSLGLGQTIAQTARIGFPAIELACAPPHFDLDTARHAAEPVARQIREAGLAVAALSLFTPGLTDPHGTRREIESAATYIRLAPLFGTSVVKLTPGAPASAEAGEEHWRLLVEALEALIPLARQSGVRLAVETHMRQLTDTLASSRRLLEAVPDETLGLTVDFLNLAFAGDRAGDAIDALGPRMYHTHLKNGFKDASGGWHFQQLGEGMLDYAEVLRRVRDAGYGGYLSIECLRRADGLDPVEAPRQDLATLRGLLAQAGMLD